MKPNKSKQLNKLTQLLCKHQYVFFPEKMNGLLHREIKSICKFCGFSKTFSLDEYKKIVEKQNKQKEKEAK